MLNIIITPDNDLQGIERLLYADPGDAWLGLFECRHNVPGFTHRHDSEDDGVIWRDADGRQRFDGNENYVPPGVNDDRRDEIEREEADRRARQYGDERDWDEEQIKRRQERGREKVEQRQRERAERERQAAEREVRAAKERAERERQAAEREVRAAKERAERERQAAERAAAAAREAAARAREAAARAERERTAAAQQEAAAAERAAATAAAVARETLNQATATERNVSQLQQQAMAAVQRVARLQQQVQATDRQAVQLEQRAAASQQRADVWANQGVEQPGTADEEEEGKGATGKTEALAALLAKRQAGTLSAPESARLTTLLAAATPTQRVSAEYLAVIGGPLNAEARATSQEQRVTRGATPARLQAAEEQLAEAQARLDREEERDRQGKDNATSLMNAMADVQAAELELARAQLNKGQSVTFQYRGSHHRIPISADNAEDFERLLAHHQKLNQIEADDDDDDPGGGGSREYNVGEDGTVTYTEDGRTYVERDEDRLADIRSGNADRVSNVDAVTVRDDDGDVVARNILAEARDVAEDDPNAGPIETTAQAERYLQQVKDLQQAWADENAAAADLQAVQQPPQDLPPEYIESIDQRTGDTVRVLNPDRITGYMQPDGTVVSAEFAEDKSQPVTAREYAPPQEPLEMLDARRQMEREAREREQAAASAQQVQDILSTAPVGTTFDPGTARAMGLDGYAGYRVDVDEQGNRKLTDVGYEREVLQMAERANLDIETADVDDLADQLRAMAQQQQAIAQREQEALLRRQGYATEEMTDAEIADLAPGVLAAAQEQYLRGLSERRERETERADAEMDALTPTYTRQQAAAEEAQAQRNEEAWNEEQAALRAWEAQLIPDESAVGDAPDEAYSRVYEILMPNGYINRVSASEAARMGIDLTERDYGDAQPMAAAGTPVVVGIDTQQIATEQPPETQPGAIQEPTAEELAQATRVYTVWDPEAYRYVDVTAAQLARMDNVARAEGMDFEEQRQLAEAGQRVVVQVTNKRAMTQQEMDLAEAVKHRTMAGYKDFLLDAGSAFITPGSAFLRSTDPERFLPDGTPFHELPADLQRQIADKADNPATNPYSRTTILGVGGVALAPLAPAGLAGAAALGGTIAAADLGGQYWQQGSLSQRDIAEGVALGLLPEWVGAGAAGLRGIRYGTGAFVTGDTLTRSGAGNLWSTQRTNIRNLDTTGLDPDVIADLNRQIDEGAEYAYGTTQGLIPAGSENLPRGLAEDINRQLMEMAQANPGQRVGVTLPSGQTVVYDPSPLSSQLGSNYVLAASPDIGFARSGSYTTMPLPFEKIATTPVETAQYFAPDYLGRFGPTGSSAFNVGADGASAADRGLIDRLAGLPERARSGLIGDKRIGGGILLPMDDVAQSGKTYRTGRGELVNEWEFIRDIYQPTAAPYSVRYGPQQRRGGLLPVYDQPEILSSVPLSPSDVRAANLRGLTSNLDRFKTGQFLSRGDGAIIGVEQAYAPGRINMLGDPETGEYSNIAKLYLERQHLKAQGVPDADLPTRPTPEFDPATRTYRTPDGQRPQQRGADGSTNQENNAGGRRDSGVGSDGQRVDDVYRDGATNPVRSPDNARGDGPASSVPDGNRRIAEPGNNNRGRVGPVDGNVANRTIEVSEDNLDRVDLDRVEQRPGDVPTRAPDVDAFTRPRGDQDEPERQTRDDEGTAPAHRSDQVQPQDFVAGAGDRRDIRSLPDRQVPNFLRPTGDVPDRPTGDVPDRPTGDVPDRPTGDVPDRPTGDVPDRPTGDVPDRPTGDVPDRPTGDVPDRPTGDVPDRPTGDVPDRPTGDVPDRPTGDVPDRPTGDVPDRPTGDVPDRPTGDVPDRPTGDVPRRTGRGAGDGSAGRAGRPPRRTDRQDEQPPQERRVLTEPGQYPDLLQWSEYSRETYDPQTGIQESEEIGATSFDSVVVLGETRQPPASADTNVAHLRLIIADAGYSALRLPERVVEAADPEIVDGGEPADAQSRRNLTPAGQYPDIVTWLRETKVTYDPRTRQKTSETVDDSNVRSLEVVGTTSEPPVESDARVGNVQITSGEQGVSAANIPTRTTRLPASGTKDVAKSAGRPGRTPGSGKKGRRPSKRRPPPEEELLDEMQPQSGAVPPPTLFIK